MFAVVSALSTFTLFGYTGTYRSADVDVLFPTPVSPKSVVVFRVLRDVWIQTVLPLVLALVFYRPVKIGWTGLFTGVQHPESANSVFRVGMIAYFMSAIAFVWLGHGLSLAMSRPDDRTDRLRTLLTWGCVALVLVPALIVNLQARNVYLPDGLVPIAQQAWLRTVFPLATAATWITMSAFTGDPTGAFVGASVLIGFMVLGAWLATRSTDWMYEQAAMKAQVTEGIRAAARSGGGMFAMASLRAQSGKLKAGKWGWFQRLTVRGPLAMLWKELLVFRRSGVWMFVFNLALSLLMAGLACTLMDRRPRTAGVLLLVMEAAIMIGPALGQSQAGFIESLRRIDLLKPLPFSSMRVVLVEVVSKAAPPIVAALGGLIVTPFVRSSMAPAAIAGLIVFPPLTLALSAVSLLFVVLLPDIEDPTQRGFRGLATLLGMVAASGPSIAVFSALVAFKTPLPLAALPAAVLALGATVLVAWLAGRVYETFNPSE